MSWFVGVDGGGTKTDFAVAREDGLPIARLQRTGCSYQAIGLERVVDLVAEGVGDCLAMVDAHLEDCGGCCLGIPCYGESPTHDRTLEESLKGRLAPAPVMLVNDVEVGWAGALECREGIHIVAGTGSIALGHGRDGSSHRCGGWIEFFGDEGSCYWVGREGMSLFSKESDGRAPRGALYQVVRRELGLTQDCDFIELVLGELAPHRERVAQFQRYVWQAAEQGDGEAAALYTRAAGELSLMVSALKQSLPLSPGTTTVSYSGGLFKAGEWVLRPLREQAEALGCQLQAPLHSAVEGALLLAVKQATERKER